MRSPISNPFASDSMMRTFNRLGVPEPANENEAPLRRYLRLSGQL